MRVHWNLSPARLYTHALARGEGELTNCGAFAARTAPHTGRSPGDRYIVSEPALGDSVDWSDVNVPLSPESYQRLRADVTDHLNHSDLFVRDARAGDDPVSGIAVRVVTTSAWHALFADNMFLRPPGSSLPDQKPDFTILHAPELSADPERHGTRSGAFIVLNLAAREALIGGTLYAGEIKKSVFSVLNYLLPNHGILPMHCSANIGSGGDTALFFGLSGTGKTTLSADPARQLIGDDEHGWGSHGVFNFEGGCYAKAIHLSPSGEPEIFRASQRFGTILENVIVDPSSGEADYDDASITENTRASYPIHYIPNAVVPSRGGHPRNVVFLSCDAFGVLPPIACLTPAQAMYHFLSGYTAKVAGTERGITEPKAAFSACFGAPFLPRHPGVYAQMLGEKLRIHSSKVWLINTGWIGGRAGAVSRIPLELTRAMVRAALDRSLDQVETVPDAHFGVHIPVAVPGVPDNLLRPREAWADAREYDEAAKRLASMFRENFENFADQVDSEVIAAGPG
jgi:phosphoenolpyruvate carboxykinase (ATP)